LVFCFGHAPISHTPVTVLRQKCPPWNFGKIFKKDGPRKKKGRAPSAEAPFLAFLFVAKQPGKKPPLICRPTPPPEKGGEKGGHSRKKEITI